MAASARCIGIFRTGRRRGFFLKLWQAGLAEYDGMEGIGWEWQSIDRSRLFTDKF
jgi:hypothetical protein